MASNQQRREAAKRKLQRQNQRRVQQAKAAHQRLMIVGVIAAVLVIAGGVWLISSLFSPGNDTAAKSGGATKAANAYGTGTDAPTATGQSGSASDTAAPTSTAPATECSYPKGGTAAKPVKPPTDLNPPKTGTVDATLTLNTGDVTIALDRANAPCAVGSFLSLAQQHYFDNTTCHRLTTAASLKVLQCGDPTGTGTGGPGYSFADELTGKEKYTTGVVAMANSGADTNGSQFFIVYGDSQLSPNYTVLGKVSSGLNVVQAIAAKGVKGGGQDGAPADPVTIEKVAVGS
ncbi:MAG: hypothetical protein BGO26_03040 [Actinobacteria bacterium 69-20]|nr:peptidylprolyl isomerase [Actinomycetota bacterium]OJV30967.1 MAG: hypothetical protein BGO26_03040 [Actinobacteria bacterium 69-20]